MSDSSNSNSAHVSHYVAGDKSPAQSSDDTKSNYYSSNNNNANHRGSNGNGTFPVVAEAKNPTSASADGDVNDDILAFYQAKEELLRRRGAER
jgi:hypothetical protein